MVVSASLTFGEFVFAQNLEGHFKVPGTHGAIQMELQTSGGYVRGALILEGRVRGVVTGDPSGDLVIEIVKKRGTVGCHTLSHRF